MDSSKAHRTLDRVIRLLTEDKYSDLSRLAPQRLTADEIRTAAHEYPYKIVYPTVPVESLINIVEIKMSDPKSWSVVVDLWTKEEGRSDLKLELELSDSEGEFYSVKIDGLHVL
ncbi:MAG: hypothetical protein H7A44_05470 [Opitutaceae bacterium]|nr:hypothetical protein [Opitutaceae bacterium]